MLNLGTALKQAKELGRVNVTEGTKGGRGRSVDRWVPVTEGAKQSLKNVARTNGHAGNVIPREMSFAEWRNYAVATWQVVSRTHDLSGFHDLRASYACERYQDLTGQPAPVVGDGRTATKDVDQAARLTIAQELGHGRADVVAAYVGSSK